MVMNSDKYTKTKIKLYNDKMFAELVYLRYYIAVVKVAENHYRSVLLINVNIL